MSFLIDTDICSAYLKNRRGLSHRFIQHSGRLYVSAITVGELFTWAFRRTTPAPTMAAIMSQLMPHVQILDFDADCAHQFGLIRAHLLNRGRRVEAIDLLIAATALVHQFIVVTHNTADFQLVPGLQLDDWLQP